jgi:hypothetical protein
VPQPAGAATDRPPAAVRITAGDFPGRSAASLDPDLRVYLADLVRPYGTPLREDLLAEGAGHAYGEMGEALMRESWPKTSRLTCCCSPFAIPDVQSRTLAALYLEQRLPGTSTGVRDLRSGLCGSPSPRSGWLARYLTLRRVPQRTGTRARTVCAASRALAG